MAVTLASLLWLLNAVAVPLVLDLDWSDLGSARSFLGFGLSASILVAVAFLLLRPVGWGTSRPKQVLVYWLPLFVALVYQIPWAPRFTVSSTDVIAIFLFAALVGFTEEFWIRGVLFGVLERKGPRWAIWGSAALFALVHFSPGGDWFLNLRRVLLVAFPFGLAAGIARARSGSWVPIAIVHTLMNFLLWAVYHPSGWWIFPLQFAVALAVSVSAYAWYATCDTGGRSGNSTFVGEC